jgi:hypothetical protein
MVELAFRFRMRRGQARNSAKISAHRPQSAAVSGSIPDGLDTCRGDPKASPGRCRWRALLDRYVLMSACRAVSS